jgi:hypothetical protein
MRRGAVNPRTASLLPAAEPSLRRVPLDYSQPLASRSGTQLQSKVCTSPAARPRPGPEPSMVFQKRESTALREWASPLCTAPDC